MKAAQRVEIDSTLGIPTVYVVQRKKKYSFDEEKIDRWIKQGRGREEREAYIPWFTVSDVPSRGKSTRVSGEEKFGKRTLHYLSTNEWYAHLHLWYDDECIGIQEQFPFLDRMETIGVAIRLKIRHPEDPITKIPIVITTDILATHLNDGTIFRRAYAIKSTESLSNERTVEKLRLEREVSQLHGFEWVLWLDTELRTNYGDNLERLYGYNRQLKPNEAQIDLLLLQFQRRPSETATSVCRECDHLAGATPGTYLAILRVLLATKQFATDLSRRRYECNLCAEFKPQGKWATRATKLLQWAHPSSASPLAVPAASDKLSTGSCYRAPGFLITRRI
ncbi:TnsA endonuclease N-terminal domain-containing protein [Cupriavidus pauculus]|nr:TnsA endonuclease C-terminal domain-containing protein [Cupriavidus pauculus]